MICPNCSYNSKGSICDVCSTEIVKVEKKVKKPIRKVSKKMASDLREYAKLRKQFLEDNPICHVYEDLKATDIHHMLGRGKYLLDTTTWIAVSRKAHEEIERNPNWAKENKYSFERLKTTI